MMNKELIQKCLLDFGLTEEEINSLTTEEAICYVKFHHEKKYGTSSILFIGFSDEDTITLSNKAKTAGLTVNSKISSNLTFVCGSETADDKRIKKSQEYGAKLLSKTEFETIFGYIDYNLSNCSLIYDTTIPIELRIAKPLSNFDKKVEIKSFSFDSNEKYFVNLYSMTCSCKDYEKKNRNQYVKGDLRRFCKHLMYDYKSNFGLKGASNFHKFIFENNQTLYGQFKNFTLENLVTPVIVNFETKDDWWNIFIENEKGIYKSYGYSPSDERFSYGEVPRGLTAPLRQKLKELKNQLNGTNSSQSSTKKSNSSNQNKSNQSKKIKSENGGCATIMILPIALILYFLLS
ncbi:hypothetical protein [Fluviicola taffensis]|uniref:hypothetical protein n=1 Tax=Fluviicola taffensis TaxID=191579 RepID=UPI0031380EB7